MATHGQILVVVGPSAPTQQKNKHKHSKLKMDVHCKQSLHYATFNNIIIIARAHIYTAEISLFDTGIGQEGIDEGHIHSNTLKNLFIGKAYYFHVSHNSEISSPQSCM